MKRTATSLRRAFFFSFFLLWASSVWAVDITTDTIWSTNQTITGTVIVRNGAKLTILPGVQVSFGSGAKLQIGRPTPPESGTLIAVGSAGTGNRIIFNKSGASKWSGIEFTSMAGANSEFRFCDVIDGGSTTNFAALSLSASIAGFSDILVQSSQNSAIEIKAAQTSIGNLTVSGFGSAAKGLRFVGVSPSVTGTNTVSGGGTGVSFELGTGNNTSSPNIANLTISNISSYALDADVTGVLESLPQFSGTLQIGASVTKLAIGGANFWVNFLSASPTVSGSGYVQEIVASDLTKSATWGGKPYISSINVQGTIGVKGQIGFPVTLTLSPGAVVEFNSGISLTVNSNGPGLASLVAQGGSLVNQKITFKGKSAANWQGISIGQNLDTQDSPSTVFQHCIFENSSSSTKFIQKTDDGLFSVTNCEFRTGAGTAIDISTGGDAYLDSLYIHDLAKGVVGSSGGSVSITNSTFTNVSGDAITANGSVSLVKGCTFQTVGVGVRGTVSTVTTVENCQFQGWSTSAIVGSSSWDIRGCAFTGSGSVLDFPARCVSTFSNPSAGNSFTPTAAMEVKLQTGNLETDAFWRRLVGTGGQGIPYRLTGNQIYEKTLTIAAGVTIKMDASNTSVTPSGAAARLLVQGTASLPVVFTSGATTPQKGDWGRVSLASGSIVEHATFDYGGGVTGATAASLLLNDACILRHCTVRNSETVGIFQAASSSGMTTPSWIEDCTVELSNGDGIRCDSDTRTNFLRVTAATNGGYGLNAVALSAEPCRVDIRESNFKINTVGALNTTHANATVDAAYCYWGHASGPTVSGGSGTGGAISGPGVASYNPWFATEVLSPFWISNPSVSPLLFKPIQGSTTFFGVPTQSSSWLIEGFNSAGTLVLRYPGNGSNVNYTWVGRKYIVNPPNMVAIGLGPLPTGTYTFTITATSNPQPTLQSILRGTMQLDATSLVAKIDSPSPLTMLAAGGSVNINGDASGAIFNSYVLEYGVGSEPASYSQISTSPNAVTNGLLGTFSVPTDQETSYLTVRLRSMDSGVPPITATDTRLFKQLSFQNPLAVPSMFSPNGDGFLDQTTLTAGITWDSNWTVDALDNASTVLKSFSGSGTQISVTWDGKNSSGILQPDGNYNLRLTATSVENPSIGVVKTVPVVINTTGQLISIFNPSSGGIVSGAQYSVQLAEAAPSSFYIRLEYGTDPVWTLVDGKNSAPSPFTIWDVTKIPSGNYSLRATITLADGTVASQTIPIKIRNLSLTVTNRVFDPLNAETTSLVVSDGQGAGSNGTLAVKAFEAIVEYDHNSQENVLNFWVGSYEGKGPEVWSQSTALVDGTATVPWNGLNGIGQPVKADKDYVFEAELTYPDGQKAFFVQSKAPFDTPDLANGFLSSLSVSLPQGEFDPYFGDGVLVHFALQQPALITVADSTATGFDKLGLLPVRLYRAGASQFLWDGRLFGKRPLAFPDTNSSYVEGVSIGLGVKASEIPETLTRVENHSLSVASAYLDPIAFHPNYGQKTTLYYTIQGRNAFVSVKVFETTDGVTENFYRNLQISTLQSPGAYSIAWDGRDDAGVFPAKDGTYTVEIIAEDPSEDSYRSIVRKSIRLHR